MAITITKLMAKREYANALHLFPPANSGWIPKTDVCSAQYNKGIDKIWEIVLEYIKLTKENGYFHKNRQQQSIRIMMASIEQQLTDHFFNKPGIEEIIENYKKMILADKISSYQAAQQLLSTYFKTISENKKKQG